MLVLSWTIACAPRAEPPPPSTPAPAPSAIDEACLARVEGPEAGGECREDTDCAPTGCSREVCVPRGLEAMTTCEVLDCFAALDTCRCSGGVCRWSLK